MKNAISYNNSNKLNSFEKLRNLWKVFWKSKKHTWVDSHSLVSSDKSLLWINSGVAGLKQYFLGIEKPPSKRIFNIQKAVRTNDIPNIGKTNRHLSFFEMMGNFSLGDYQKKEAILWAWEFLTDEKWLNLDKDRLYITVFRDDEVAIEICKKNIKIDSEHLILGDKSTNFWDLGVGPCGPNLEIFYDLGKEFDLQNEGVDLLKKNKDNERYLEIWNIVFSELLNVGNNKYTNLPTKNIDTGAGLERLLVVLENKNNCFETSAFGDLMEYLSGHIGFNYTIKTKKNKSKSWEIKPYHFRETTEELTEKQSLDNRRLKIIVDHMRTVVFLLSDLLEDQVEINLNNKRGYVIKKLIRHACLQLFLLRGNFSSHILTLASQTPKGLNEEKWEPLLHNVMTPAIVKKMKKYYPYLEKQNQKNQVQNIILEQEKRFLLLLKNVNVKKLFILSKNTTIKGEEIFSLVTEIGIPLPLLEQIAKERKLLLEIDVFNDLWTKHQKISSTKKEEFIKPWYFLLFPSKKPTTFIENQTFSSKAKVLAIFVNQQLLSKTSDTECWVVFDQTPFYAQRGGQVSDVGELIKNKTKSAILDVQFNKNNQYLHLIDLKGNVAVNDVVELKVDHSRRLLIQNNHSATHLLHFALRSVISTKIKQNGSLNNNEYLRLDVFVFDKTIDLKFLKQAEQKVNDFIQKKITPQINWFSFKEAENLKALNFFNVKINHDQKVRVVNFDSHSIEVCGGTHVSNTSHIEQFLINKIKKIGWQSYRIYALTTKKTINDFLLIEKQQFSDFLKKHNSSIEKILKNKNLKVLFQEMIANNDFYLLQNQKKNELKKQIKNYYLQEKNMQVNKIAKNYIISKSDFYKIWYRKSSNNLKPTPLHDQNKFWEYDLIWHNLEIDANVKEYNRLNFLRTVFDQYMNHEKRFLFFFFFNDSKNYNFIFYFPNFLFDLKLENYFKNYFQDQIKFRIQQNKIQGVIFNLDSNKFLEEFIEHLNKKVTDWQKKFNE